TSLCRKTRKSLVFNNPGNDAMGILTVSRFHVIFFFFFFLRYAVAIILVKYLTSTIFWEHIFL
uniref:Uncharacterized protein n=1 Tax=Monodon monoceros TaxID=40151 RepID=A0A8C6BNB3_MONMO